MTANRHPVDALADIRAKIRNLQDGEKSLRAYILATKDLLGDEHTAVISSQTQSVLDRAALEEAFGVAAVNACCKPRKITTLRVKHRAA